jgi:excisionase family DNA binding protein
VPKRRTAEADTGAAVSTPGRSGELLTPGQVAEELKVPIATLYQWRSRGGGPPALRIGRHLRYRSEDIDGWLAARVTDGVD